MAGVPSRGLMSSVGNVFDQDCTENDVAYSWGQGFECELYWELVGYN